MNTNISQKHVGILKALCEPSRLKLLTAISKGEICACELPALIKKSQPVVSLHLSVLANAGLVEVRPQGAKRIYSISKLGKKALHDIQCWQ